MEISTTILIIFFSLLLEGFFSGSEMAVVSADQLKLRHLAAKGSKGAKLALKMLEKPEWLLSITLIGTNISVVTNTSWNTFLSFLKRNRFLITVRTMLINKLVNRRESAAMMG